MTDKLEAAHAASTDKACALEASNRELQDKHQLQDKHARLHPDLKDKHARLHPGLQDKHARLHLYLDHSPTRTFSVEP